MAEENDVIVPGPTDEEARISSLVSKGLDPTITDFDYTNYERVDFSPEYFAQIMKLTGGDSVSGIGSDGNVVKYDANQIFAIQAADEFNQRTGMGSYKDFKEGTSKFQPGLKFTDADILKYLTTMEEKGFFDPLARRVVTNVPSSAAFGVGFTAGKKIQSFLPTVTPVKTGFPRVDRLANIGITGYNVGKFSLPFVTGVGGSFLTSMTADEPFAEFIYGTKKTLPTPDTYSTQRAAEGVADVLSFSPYAYLTDKASSNFVTDYLANRFKLNNELFGSGFSFDADYLRRNPLSAQIKSAMQSARGPRRKEIGPDGQPTSIDAPQILEGKAYMGPLDMAQLSERGVAQVLQGQIPEPHLRRLMAIETALKNAGEDARKNPKLALFYETLAAGGAGLFVKSAAEADPTGTSETFAEIGGAGGVPFVGQTLIALTGARMNSLLKLTRNIKDQGLISGTSYTVRKLAEEGRSRKGVKEILKQLDEISSIETNEDLELLIQALENSPLGTPRKTAGQVTKDPAIMGMEAALKRDFDNLSAAQKAAREEEIRKFERVLEILSFGDRDNELGTELGKEAATVAADIKYTIFQKVLHNRLRHAEDELLRAHEQIKRSNMTVRDEDGNVIPRRVLDAMDSIDLSDRLFRLVEQQMELARNRQKELYGRVGNLEITDFFKEDGTPTDIPTFLAVLADEGPFIKQSKVKKELSDLFSYAQQLSDELGLGMAFTDEGTALGDFLKTFNQMEGAGTSMINIRSGATLEPTAFLGNFVDRLNRPDGMRFDLELDDAFMPQEVSDDFINAARREVENYISSSQATIQGTDPNAVKLLNGYLAALVERRGKDDTGGDVLAAVSLDGLRQIRSQALDSARNGDLSKNSRRIAGLIASGIEDDIINFARYGDTEGLKANQINALREANAYTRAYADVFYRSFVGDAMAQTKDGRFRQAPELIFQSFDGERFDPDFLKIRDIQAVGDFLNNQNIPGAQGTLNSVNGVIDRILRQARYEAYDPKTKTYSEKRLNNFLNNQKRVAKMFPDLFEDLKNFDNAQALFRAVEDQGNKTEALLSKQINFTNLLRDAKGQIRTNPTIAIAEAMKAGRDQIPLLDDILSVIPQKGQEKAVRYWVLEEPTTGVKQTFFKQKDANKAKEASLPGSKVRQVDLTVDRDEAIAGFKSSFFEYLIYGVSSDGKIRPMRDPRAIYNALFEKPMMAKAGRTKGRARTFTVAEYLKRKGIFTESDLTTTREALTALIDAKVGEKGFDLIADFEEAKPMLDFALAISGSAIGTKTQKMISGGDSGPGALIAAGKGAEAMRNIFLRMPRTQRMMFTADLLQDPRLLAKMLRKYGQGEQSRGVAGAIFDYLKKQGYVSLPRRAYAVSGDEESTYTEDENSFDPFEPNVEPPEPVVTEPPDKEASLNIPTSAPTLNVGPAPSPSFQLASASLPQTTPQSGPVDRTRYAAMFPNDPASALIRQGIGSMMG